MQKVQVACVVGIMAFASLWFLVPQAARADLSTLTYSNKAFSASSQLPNGGESLAFSSDGTHMYLSSNYSGTTIYEYTLSTPWDITTALYTGSGNAVADGITGLYFSSDGTKMYALEFYNDILDEYTLSTPWNISTISKIASMAVPYGNNYTMTFSSDGTKLYDFNEYTDTMYEYTLATPWDITTASQTGSIAEPSGYILGAAFSSDGSTLYLLHQSISSGDASLEQYTLSTPWNITTAANDSKTFALTNQDGYMHGLATNATAGYLYTLGGGNGPYDVFWYTMNPPDTTPPLVSLVLPTSGEATSSTMTLVASSSDNVAVAGVTFYIDGTKEGSEVTNPPYTILYTTTATSSGTHTAFAVARDTSNNYATSSAVTFMINNLAAPAFVTASTTSNAATITWSTANAGSSQIFFGVSSDVASATPTYDTGGVTRHAVSLSGLSVCTTYQFVAVSTSLSNETSTSSPSTFTTAGCTGNAAIIAHNQNIISMNGGGTLTQGAVTLTIPTMFTASSSSATFQADQLNSTNFFATAGTPNGFEQAGNTVVHLVALIKQTTALSTFSTPITVTLSYAPSDVASLETSSLWIYRYDSGTWTPLSGCSVNTSAHTVTCTTSNFSDFALFGTAAPAQATVAGSPVAAGGPVEYGCTDPRALNFQPWVANNPTLCHYAPQNLSTTLDASITPTVATSTAPAPHLFTRWLKEGMRGLDVLALQIYLNANGFPVAVSGPGSSGRETKYFGSKTKAALIAFQNAHAIAILHPSGLTVGTGFFGPSTIEYVNSH